MLRTLPDECAQTCVTSPPYWGLRDYGIDGQLGLEPTPDEYVARMVAVFAEVRRVLRADGTLWLNLGDSYNAYNGNRGASAGFSDGAAGRGHPEHGCGLTASTLKPKDLVGIPWRVAFALQADGWYLRQDIIWAKPNPMPESVTDRCTKAHEYMFLLSKSARYYYDADAIAEKFADARMGNPNGGGNYARSVPGWEAEHVQSGLKRGEWNTDGAKTFRNRRSVWTVATTPYPEAHFATFPPALIEPCILAGAPTGGVVLDPFMGSGTTAQVAQNLGRRWIGVELNADYIALQQARTAQQAFAL